MLFRKGGGIHTGRICRITWECCPMGINCGGWGLSIRTEDIARFGQLYLQDGIWKGARVLPEGWVQEATRSHISNGEDPGSDWSRGYGYQFWHCRHNAYRGDGAFGQFCIVMPDQNAVIAITSGLDDMQSALESVWKHLLSAMGDAELPENPPVCATLQKFLRSLALFPPKGRNSSPQTLDRTGKSYVLEENEPGWERISFEFLAERCNLRLREKGKGIVEIHCGTGDWMENPEHADWLPGKIMASSVWTEDVVCQITLRFIETPFYFTLRCSFDGEDIRISASRNASFGPREIPVIHGSMAGV